MVAASAGIIRRFLQHYFGARLSQAAYRCTGRVRLPASDRADLRQSGALWPGQQCAQSLGLRCCPGGHRYLSLRQVGGTAACYREKPGLPGMNAPTLRCPRQSTPDMHLVRRNMRLAGCHCTREFSCTPGAPPRLLQAALCLTTSPGHSSRSAPCKPSCAINPSRPKPDGRA